MKNFAIKLTLSIAIAYSIVACSDKSTANRSAIIPQPAKLTTQAGVFAISDKTTLYTNSQHIQTDYLDEWLSEMPFTIAQKTSAKTDNSINLIISDNSTQGSPEAYTLKISPSGITIEATTPIGVFYGLQTLAQIYDHDRNTFACQTITDQPLLSHRGFLIEMSDRLLSVDFIKKQLSTMARYKLNNFYWNITTDSLRYTDEDMENVVKYAEKRGVKIIPTMKISLLKPIEIKTDSLKNILSHFRSDYLYIIDADIEQTFGPQCKRCYKPTRDSLQNTPQAKSINILSAFAKQYGHKIITIDSIGSGFNLDMYQNNPMVESEAATGLLPAEMVYSSKPDPDDSLNTIRIYAKLDTRFAKSDSVMEYMTYPRLLALAEMAWSRPERKSYLDFKRRVATASDFLRSKHYNVFDIDKEQSVRPESLEPMQNLAQGKTIHHHIMYDDQFPGSGDSALIDGERGGWSYDDGRWQGYQGSGINTTIDLNTPTEIKSILATFIQDRLGRIWLPKSVDISISDNGKEFTPLATVESEISPDDKGYYLVPMGWSGAPVTTRYVRYTAKPNNLSRSWIFTDEIVVQ